jgi:Heat induced stress protein YflT domain
MIYRKLYQAQLRPGLEQNWALRQTADYKRDQVTEIPAPRAIRRTEEFLTASRQGGGGHVSCWPMVRAIRPAPRKGSVMQARDTVVAVFDDRDDAQDAIEALKDANIRGEDIGLVARNREETAAVADETGTKAGEGAATGAVAGGLLGGIGGFLVGIGALAIPVVGPVIAAGAFATALAGAAVGAGVGAIAGALIGMGIPEDEANWYEERVQAGGWLVSVRAPGRYDEVRAILRDEGGKDYEAGMSTAGYRSWNEASPDFRSRYETQYGAGRWETMEPAHRFGYEAYGRSRTQGMQGDWRTSEPELRRDWESRGMGSWDEHRSHIRHGYDYGRGRGHFRDYDDDDSKEIAGGAVAGGVTGAVAGGLVGGPVGAAGGAAIGGAAGAAAGNAVGDADDTEENREPRRRL